MLVVYTMLLAFQSRWRLRTKAVNTLSRIDVSRRLDFSMRLLAIDIPDTRRLYTCKGATTLKLLLIADQVRGLSSLLYILLLIGMS